MQENRAFTSCDGEQQQLRIFMVADVRDQIKRHNIVQGKTPASCSGKTQSSDVMKYFVVLKKALKHPRMAETENYYCATLDRRLRSVLNERASKLPSEKVHKIVTALMKIVEVTANTRRPNIIREGYSDTGMYPVSFEKSMSKCQRRLSEADYKCMEDCIPAAAIEFQSKGTLSEEWMDEHGIINVNTVGSMPKDERALHQQRAVIFNHEVIQGQWDIYQTRNDVDNKEKEKAQQFLDREAAKAAKTTATAAAKLVEEERKRNLTPEQRRQEQEAKKEAAAQRKFQKAENARQKTAHSRQILGLS